MNLNSKPWISARAVIVMAEYNEISDKISEKVSDISQPIGMFEIKIFCIKQIHEIKTNLFWKMNEQLSHRSTYDIWLNVQRNVALIMSDEIFDELFYSVFDEIFNGTVN